MKQQRFHASCSKIQRNIVFHNQHECQEWRALTCSYFSKCYIVDLASYRYKDNSLPPSTGARTMMTHVSPHWFWQGWRHSVQHRATTKTPLCLGSSVVLASPLSAEVGFASPPFFGRQSLPAEIDARGKGIADAPCTTSSSMHWSAWRPYLASIWDNPCTPSLVAQTLVRKLGSPISSSTKPHVD